MEFPYQSPSFTFHSSFSLYMLMIKLHISNTPLTFIYVALCSNRQASKVVLHQRITTKNVNYSKNRKSSIKTEGKSHSCTMYWKPFQVNSFWSGGQCKCQGVTCFKVVEHQLRKYDHPIVWTSILGLDKSIQCSDLYSCKVRILAKRVIDGLKTKQ